MTSFKLFTAEIVVEVVQRFKEQYERCQDDENAIAKLKQKISKALQVQDMEQESATEDTLTFALSQDVSLEMIKVKAGSFMMGSPGQDMKQESSTEDILTFALSQGVSLEMIKVKAGSFMMGSPENEAGRDEDERLHRVTITKDYYLGKYPVTQAQWIAIMGDNPSRFKGDNLPVESISWDDAKEFCTRLNNAAGSKLPAGYKFDLPTEAQWEYACRAGTTTAYFWGNSCNGYEANCNGNYPCGTGRQGPYLGQTSTVGQYQPNPWGFYDMHGNVWEWCRDWYENYGEDAIDPVVPSSVSSYRARRGGCWSYYAGHCRSASRNNFTPAFRGSYLGFRLGLVKL